MQKIKLLFIFYRNYIIPSLMLTGLCCWIFISHGPATLSSLFLFKILTYAPIAFLVHERRKETYYFYANLGLGWRALYLGSMAPDLVFFILLLTALYPYAAAGSR
jgi:hypothetical protein